MNKKFLVSLLLLLAIATGMSAVNTIVTFPGGSKNGSVQFNKNGQFSGDTQIIYSTSTLTLNVPGIRVSTVTVAGVTYYFPVSETSGGYLRTDGSGGLTWETPTTTVSGVAAPIGVFDGSVRISSPTQGFVFNGTDFVVTLAGGATAQIALDSTVTKLGSSIDLTSEVTGTLPAGNLPSTVVYTNTNQTISGIKTITSSATVTGGLLVASGITTDSITVTGISASRPVKTDATNKLSTGQINLASSNEVTGNLPVANLNGGSGATSSTCWKGDGTWGDCGSGGGGGSSSLEIMANNLRVSSPTPTAKFNGTSNGIGINATTSGSTATLTFSMLPGNTNYINSPATGTWVNTKGIVASTVTATSISNTQIVVAGTNGLLQGDPLLTWDGGRVIALKLVGSDDLSDPSPLGGTGVAAQVGSSYGAQRARALYGKTNAGSILSHAVEGDCSASGSPECAGGYFKAQGASATNIGVFASASGGTSNTAFRADAGQSIFMGSSTFNGSIVISSGLIASGSAGTNGQVLTSGGAGTIPSWTTVSGGGGSGGYNLQPATVTVQVPLGIYGSTFSFTGPQQSTVTYGLTVGSLTVSNASGGNLSLSNDNGSSFYQVVGSSSDATVGQCAVWTSSWTLVSSPCGTGGGGGGGSIGGTINNASQFSLTYYSVPGSSNALSGSSIASVYASSMTLNTSTQTANQVLFDYSASSMTISSITANDVYADRIYGIPYNTKPYFSYGLETPGAIAIDAPGSLNFYQTNTFSNRVAFVSSASLSNQNYVMMSAYPSADGQVLSAKGPNTLGYYDLYWKDDATGGGSGGGGYAVQPATVSFNLAQGATISSVTVSSNAVINQTTFYANGNIVTSGLSYNYLGKSLAITTDIGGLLGSPIYGSHIKAFTDTDIPVGGYGYVENTGTTAPTIGHGMGYFGLAKDTAGSRHPLYGIEGRTNAYGLNTTEYAGVLSLGTHVGPYNGTLSGIIVRSEMTTDGSTPLSTGTMKMVDIRAPVGSGFTGQTHAIYSEAAYPSFLTGNLGIGAGTSNTANQLQINTGGNALQATLIQSGNNANYVFSQWGRAGADATLAVSAGANQFFTGSAAGDMIMRAENAASAFQIGAGTDAPALTVNKSSVTFPASVYMNGPVNVSSVTYLGSTVGTSGQVYTSNGPGSAPSWSTPSGSGDVLKAGNNTYTANNTYLSSTTFVSTVTITASSMNFNDVMLNLSSATLKNNTSIYLNDKNDSHYVSIRSSENVDNSYQLTLSSMAAPLPGMVLMSSITSNTTTQMVWNPAPEYYTLRTSSITFGSVLSTSPISMPMIANTTSYFDCYIILRTTISTTGAKLAILSPTVTGSTISYRAEIPLAADGTDSAWVGWGTTSDDAVTSTSLPSATFYTANINGYYVAGPNGAGNLNVRFASELPNTPSITMKEGSYCSVLRPPQ